jgi:homopolymeric O-antigen transport system permease protein
VWQYRDLLYFLIRRNVAIRYKQTVFGAAWAVSQPLALAVVFSLFLGLVFHVNPRGGVPYGPFVLCGLIIWLFFARSLSDCANSTRSSGRLITKVYFPRLVIPLAAVVPPVIDFAVALVVLLGVILAHGLLPSPHIFLVPVILFLAVLVAFGAGLWFSALIVRYRDVGLLVPTLIQMGLFASAVLYPLSLVPDSVKPLYVLNPMVGVTEGFRWAVLPGAADPGFLLLVPALAGALLVISGLLYFQRAEATFVDVI